MITPQSRYLGCLLGLATGDAVGTRLEFKPPGSFEPIDDMLGGGPFNLEAGQWTDDTSMALCLADSLLECGDFNPADQLERYCRWYEQGYLSSNGRCFDIGITVSSALSSYRQTCDPFSGSTDPYAAGNGSIMRLAPVPMFYALPERAVEMSGISSKTTHGAKACIDACRYFGGLIFGALSGEPKEVLLAEGYSPLAFGWKDAPLCDDIKQIAQGSFKTKQPPEIRGTGYVVESLEAALWAFHHSNDFKEGCLLAVNLGDDADTTGAIYGQLAGAFYGEEAIPESWRNRLAHHDLIRQFARSLFEQRINDQTD